jgi:NAD(P)-dependent dehydrogenase (short-subunit alcohol dehydrogenase family)
VASDPQRVALVTGGSRGIGRAVVEALLGEGYAVAFCSRNPDAVADAQAALLARWPGKVAGETVDVRQQPQVASWIAAAADRFGRIDCLVNNAGLGAFGPVDEIAPESFREVLETNLFGPFYAIAAAAPILRKQGGGSIFNVGSLAAKNPFAGGAAYNASKFGLVGFSEALMLDVRQQGIRVSCIMPGSVNTYFNDNQPSDEGAWKIQPEDIGQVVMDLLSLPKNSLVSRIEMRPARVKGR